MPRARPPAGKVVAFPAPKLSPRLTARRIAVLREAMRAGANVGTAALFEAMALNVLARLTDIEARVAQLESERS